MLAGAASHGWAGAGAVATTRQTGLTPAAWSLTPGVNLHSWRIPFPQFAG